MTSRPLRSAARAAHNLRLRVRPSSSRAASSSTSSASASASVPTPSSASSSSNFTPALPSGQNPAYDLALSYLSAHTTSTLSLITPSTPPSVAENLHVRALVNDPATRRAFRAAQRAGAASRGLNAGTPTSSSAAMRHLAEKAWVAEGGLDLLMQRVHQMGIVPDVLPSISRTQPLSLTLDSNPTSEPIEPGIIVEARDMAQPTITAHLLHHPAGLVPTAENPTPSAPHTLIILDADAPLPSGHTYRSRLLAWKDDIPLSVSSGPVDLLSPEIGVERLAYRPPTPEPGSGKHRYVAILLPTSSAPEFKDSYADATQEGSGSFDLRSCLANPRGGSAGATPQITGITLFRSAHTPASAEFIAEAYARAHGGADVPSYGKPPIEARYGYPLSAEQRRREAIREEAVVRAVQGMNAELEEMGVHVEMEGKGGPEEGAARRE